MNILKLLAARYFLVAYAGIIAFIFSPLLIVLLANILATIAGCPDGMQLSNAGCTNGDIIYAISQAGWLLVFTVPVGLILLGAVLLVNVVAFVLLKKRALVAGYVLNRIKKKIVK